MPTSRTAPERRRLRDRLRELERQAAPLQPGKRERGRLRRGVVAAGERYLDGLAEQRAFVEPVPGEALGAAYGGFFLLTDEGRERLRGLDGSDSCVLDPHKGLFLPYGSGLLLVREVRALAAAHAATGAYLQDAPREDEGGELSPSDLSPELSRHFRALRLWLPLTLLGTAPFRAALEEKLLLARYFHQEAQAAGFEVGPPPDLSIVPFRWAPPGIDPETADRLNQELVDRVRRDGRVFLSSTRLDGRFTLRLAALSCFTHRRTIDLALRVLGEQAAALRLPDSTPQPSPKETA